VFLTAAHCAEDGERVGVTFDTAYEAGDRVYYGTFEADPLYSQVQSDPHDIAVVVFDRPVRGIDPATLPAADSLSDLSGSQTFTPVGYGAYEVTNGPGGTPVPLRRRRGDHDHRRRVCRSTNVVYRLDTESARTFLAQCVELP
jgi:hypothetical protein